MRHFTSASGARGLSRSLCRHVVFCVLVVHGLGGCDFTAPAAGDGRGEGPGHRQQSLALTPEQELQLGRQAYREILSQPERYGRALPSDDPDVVRVRTVMRRLVQAAGIEPLQREINLHVRGYRFEWEVNVLKNPQRNAFCLPAGKMAVFTGILPVAENDDQLAMVMSHEIAHALAHHASERIAREMGYERALQVLGGGVGDNRARQQVLGALGAGVGLFGKKYERAQESEADHIGVFLMTFADYDPQEAIRFWERMLAASGGGNVPEILSDHPSDQRRIDDLKHWVPQAQLGKRFYDEGRIAPAPDR